MKEGSLIFADNIKYLLSKNQLTVAKLSKDINLAFTTIQRIITQEITDPKLSSILKIADYFNIDIKSLLYVDLKTSANNQHVQGLAISVPILTIGDLEKYGDISNIDLTNWSKRKNIISYENICNDDNLFAIEAMPSFYPRFRQGNLIVFNKNQKPQDGDVVLVKFNSSEQYSLRDLSIDPPNWILKPIVTNSETLFYDKKDHKITGVLVLAIMNPNQ